MTHQVPKNTFFDDLMNAFMHPCEKNLHLDHAPLLKWLRSGEPFRAWIFVCRRVEQKNSGGRIEMSHTPHIDVGNTKLGPCSQFFVESWDAGIQLSI